MSEQLRIGEYTDPGPREENQDACGAFGAGEGAAPFVVAFVADGMGGMEAGREASQAAQEAVKVAALHLNADVLVDIGHQVQYTLDLSRVANEAVLQALAGRTGGTTFTAVSIVGDRVALGHVGDSRAYLFGNGRTELLTKDHSLVAALVATGQMTLEEAEVSPDRNKILRSLGSANASEPGYADDLSAGGVHGATLTLEPGQGVAVMSDGVWGALGTAGIEHLLNDPTVLALPERDIAQALVSTALRCNTDDNSSAVVVRRPLSSAPVVPARRFVGNETVDLNARGGAAPALPVGRAPVLSPNDLDSEPNQVAANRGADSPKRRRLSLAQKSLAGVGVIAVVGALAALIGKPSKSTGGSTIPDTLRASVPAARDTSIPLGPTAETSSVGDSRVPSSPISNLLYTGKLLRLSASPPGFELLARSGRNTTVTPVALSDGQFAFGEPYPRESSASNVLDEVRGVVSLLNTNEGVVVQRPELPDSRPLNVQGATSVSIGGRRAFSVTFGDRIDLYSWNSDSVLLEWANYRTTVKEAFVSPPVLNSDQTWFVGVKSDVVEVCELSSSPLRCTPMPNVGPTDGLVAAWSQDSHQIVTVRGSKGTLWDLSVDPVSRSLSFSEVKPVGTPNLQSNIQATTATGKLQSASDAGAAKSTPTSLAISKPTAKVAPTTTARGVSTSTITAASTLAISVPSSAPTTVAPAAVVSGESSPYPAPERVSTRETTPVQTVETTVA